MSSFPQYLQMLGFTATQMGMVATGYTFCAMIMRIFAGNLIDSKGRRTMGLLGLMLFGVPLLGMAFVTQSNFVIIACRFVQGFGASLCSIATGTMAPDVLPKERMAEGIGYFGLFNSLATAIGPAVGIGFLQRGQTGTFFAFSGVMIVLAFGVMMTMNYEKAMAKQKAADEINAPSVEPEEKETFFLWNFFDKKAVPAAIVAASMTISTSAVTNFISPYAKTAGLLGVGSFFTVQALFMIVSRLTSGRLAKKIGTFNTLAIGFVLDAISLVILSMATNTAMLYASAAFLGLGGGFCYPILNVLAVEGASPSRRGKATSTYYAAFDIGMGVGAAIWGIVIDNFGGYRTMYAATAAFLGVTVALAAILLRKKPKAQKA